MEAIDLTELEPINISIGGTENSKSTSSLGEGMELLMNDKKSSDTSKTKIDLGELDKLEDELNDLSSINIQPDLKNDGHDLKKVDTNNSFGGFANSILGLNDNKNVEPVTGNDSKLGTSTAESMGTQSKTWDGFTKMSSMGGDSKY